MPSSDFGNLTPLIQAVFELRPKSVLDLGAGFGKYGMLCREYLDVALGRPFKADWKTFIVGVDGFAAYRNAIHDFVYDEFRVENFMENAERYQGFELVLMIDSLEHVEKATGLELLGNLIRKNKNVIVS